MCMAESMEKNIEHYGIMGTFKKIDDIYNDAIVRMKVRQVFFNTLIKNKWEFK